MQSEIVINKSYEELSEENNRLLNELLINKKIIKLC
jgi:hypothetical protein